MVQTEVFFRAINEEIAQLDGTSTTLYLCECGNPVCKEGIALTPDVVVRLHAAPRDFVVLAGHEIPDRRDHCRRGGSDGYVIVRKNA